MSLGDKLFFIIVIYNQLISENNLINSLKKFGPVVIVDNSTENAIRDNNDIFCEQQKFVYIDMEGNKGISKAYNTALKRIQRKEKNFWFMTLDQDTIVSESYLENVKKSIEENPSVKIKTGLINFNSGIASPKNNKNHSITRTGIFKDIICINSCLVLHSDLIKRVNGYDENLFLDMVDYLLFYKINSIQLEKIEVVEGYIYQNFSGEEYTDYSKTIKRYRMYKADFVRYCQITKKGNLYKYKTLLRRRLNIVIKFRRIF